MVQLDYKSGVPIYDQLVSGIVRLKMLGALKGGDALPSVRQMALKLGINPNTVQRAYTILEEKGVIYSVAGKGSFISNDIKVDSVLNEISLKNFKKEALEALKIGVPANELINIIKSLEGSVEVRSND